MDRSNGYEQVATAFLAGRGGPATAGIGATTVRAWARTLPPGVAVLDLGCGSGVPITQVLIEEGFDVYGIDASPSLAAAFRDRFPNAHIACEAVEDSAFFDRSFDAVIAWGLMFVLPAPSQFSLLERIGEVLVPGGRLLFTSSVRAGTWLDAMTGRNCQSLGRKAYLEQLGRVGLVLHQEYDDEGKNHYYDVLKTSTAGTRR